MPLDQETVRRIRSAVDSTRLIETAVSLVEIPSPTRSAGPVSDRLAELLVAERFEVERVDAGWSAAPAVVARLPAGKPGRTLQFSGHLDTVHLPFVPPRVEGGLLYGSGASDMKGGVAAMVEAMRALRDTDLLPAGSILLTAYDLHEIPWGDGSQVDALIDAGFVGDGVLIPEYLCNQLPVVGRGQAVFEVCISRPGEPVHEVLGGIEQPNVIVAGADLVRRFADLDRELSQNQHPLAGRDSIFVGRVSSGEIYNQSPTEFELAGTRRWLPGTPVEQVKVQYDSLLSEVAKRHGVKVDGKFSLARDAFQIEEDSALVTAFQSAYRTMEGRELAIGCKPFIDDGNSFVCRGGISAITHGPNAKGAHTLYEQVPVDELKRVAITYALTAIEFCAA